MRENKARYWIALIIFFVLSTVVIPLVSGQDASSAIVQINDPGNGAIVEYECHVQGTSTGLGDHNLHLYILVRGVGTSKWWVQPPTIMGGDGSWVAIAYLGEKNKGNNEKFAIKAIITNETQTYTVADTFNVNELPSLVAEDQIVVTRNDRGWRECIVSPIGLAVIGIIITIIGIIIAIWYSKRRLGLITEENER